MAFFKTAAVVKKLPKTRSGKILRGTIRKIADGLEYRVPATIEDAGTLEEVTGRAAGHVEKVLLENTMRECKWNKTRAAKKLGVSPKTLLAKLRGAGLEE